MYGSSRLFLIAPIRARISANPSFPMPNFALRSGSACFKIEHVAMLKRVCGPYPPNHLPIPYLFFIGLRVSESCQDESLQMISLGSRPVLPPAVIAGDFGMGSAVGCKVEVAFATDDDAEVDVVSSNGNGSGSFSCSQTG